MMTVEPADAERGQSHRESLPRKVASPSNLEEELILLDYAKLAPRDRLGLKESPLRLAPLPVLGWGSTNSGPLRL